MAAGTADASGNGSRQVLGRAVILLGPPGAGKGTQAQRIAQWYRVPHLSTGDMFRDNIRRGTKLGLEAKPLMERGELVPDEIVLGMVKDRIAQPDCVNGFLFDGFPRTLAQADALDKLCQGHNLGGSIVLHLIVQPESLLRRLTGRRICKTGGHIYNIYDRPPVREGVCDEDGSELIHRPDDTEAVIRDRLITFDQVTMPLVGYYHERGVLRSVDAMYDADIVTGEIRKILDGAIAPK